MFTEQQIAYMRRIGINKDFSNLSKLSDKDRIEIEDTVAARLMYSGFDENYEPTKEGLMCESIIDVVTSIS